MNEDRSHNYHGREDTYRRYPPLFPPQERARKTNRHGVKNDEMPTISVECEDRVATRAEIEGIRGEWEEDGRGVVDQREK